MTQDKIHARAESATDAQPTRAPEDTFKSKDDAAPSAKKKSLDFAKLDLRVEKVDERISPSETNVFDK